MLYFRENSICWLCLLKTTCNREVRAEDKRRYTSYFSGLIESNIDLLQGKLFVLKSYSLWYKIVTDEYHVDFEHLMKKTSLVMIGHSVVQ